MNSMIAFFKSIYFYIVNSYVKKSESKKCIYKVVESYRNSATGKQMVMLKILDANRGFFKMSAVELVLYRRDILAGCNVDDVVTIVGLAATEKETKIIQRKQIAYKYFAFLAMLFGAALVTANVASAKLMAIFGLTMTGGTLPYPLAYILGDVITEVYGYKRARQLIWGAIFCNLFLVFFIYLTIISPPSMYWHHQNEYALVLGSVPRIVFASLVSYWAGEFINSYILAKMKIVSHGRNLLRRILCSSAVGITTDTFLFVFIAYVGVLPINQMFMFSIRVYLFKVICEFVATPLTMWLIGIIKSKENLDIFDTNTRFTPFSLDIEYSQENNRIKSVSIAEGDEHDESGVDDGEQPYSVTNLIK